MGDSIVIPSGQKLVIPSGQLASAVPAGIVISSNTDYHFTLLCNPYPTEERLSRTPAKNVPSTAVPIYNTITGGSSWTVQANYRLNFRVYIDGTIRDSAEGVDSSSSYVGKAAGGSEYGVAQVFNVGSNGGLLTKIEVYCSLVVSGGAINAECTIKTGNTPGSGAVLGVGAQFTLPTADMWNTVYQSA